MEGHLASILGAFAFGRWTTKNAANRQAVGGRLAGPVMDENRGRTIRD